MVCVVKLNTLWQLKKYNSIVNVIMCIKICRSDVLLIQICCKATHRGVKSFWFGFIFRIFLCCCFRVQLVVVYN